MLITNYTDVTFEVMSNKKMNYDTSFDCHSSFPRKSTSLFKCSHVTPLSIAINTDFVTKDIGKYKFQLFKAQLYRK